MTVAPPPVPRADPSTRSYIERFREAAGRFPDRIAFRQKLGGSYRQVSYREAAAQSEHVARGLIALGVRPADRVAIISENRPEWVVSYLAILAAGATVVPLDTQISMGEWRRLVDDSEAKVVLTSGLHHGNVAAALEGSPAADRIVRFDHGPDGTPGFDLARLEALGAGAGGDLEIPQAASSDVVVIIYTSGTTGKPKGVMLTQGNITGEIAAVLSIVHADESDVFLCLLPLQHVFASVTTFLLPLTIGAQVVFADTLKRAEILQALEEAGITILATVPQFFYLFHGRIEEELKKKPVLLRRIFGAMRIVNRIALRARVNLGKALFGKIHAAFGSRLRLFVSGGSAFDPKVAQAFHDLGFTILQGYGLTETTGGCTVTRIEENVIGSVGKPIPGVDVKIDGPDPTGVGEVAIRGQVVMKGYYKDPEATAAAVRDGWFFSGDLGRLDAAGNLFITGRRKEVIVLPSGKNIYPDELETHYQQSPAIAEIAILGIAEPGAFAASERLHAVVVPDFENLKSRKIANTREFLRDEIARLSNELPKYKRLMSYQIQKDPLPRTTTRKIKRLELKKRIEQGEMPDVEAPAPAAPDSPEDAVLRASRTGEEVLRAIRETHERVGPLDLGMNLELDLGFDSMERVELLAALEQSLGVSLPDDFGAEVHTVRDLIRRLDEATSASTGAGERARQSWRDILSEDAVREAGDWVRFSGPAMSAAKWIGLRAFYLLFRVLLRLEVRGIENLPAAGPFLICPNHQSYIDPFVVMSALPFRVFRRVFFVGYSAYFQNWVMKVLARLANIVPVDPDAHLLRAMKVGAFGLRQGRVLCIFPEGGRTIEGDLMPFKKGAAILAREVGVPVVPVGLTGLYEVWPRGGRRIRFHPVKLAFGRPLEPSAGEAPYDADTERIQAAVADLVEKLKEHNKL